LVADGLLEVVPLDDDRGRDSGGLREGGDDSDGEGSGSQGTRPAALPSRLWSVDQEASGPLPSLKVRLMREQHVHYLINGAQPALRKRLAAAVAAKETAGPWGRRPRPLSPLSLSLVSMCINA
jgi:hypothetical protein